VTGFSVFLPKPIGLRVLTSSILTLATASGRSAGAAAPIAPTR
jgi:hypothetical protein